MAILITILLNLEVGYACKDQGVDAFFLEKEDALAYAEAFKEHHQYQVMEFVRWKRRRII